MSPYTAVETSCLPPVRPAYGSHLANDVATGQRFPDRIFSTPVDNSVENLPGVRRSASKACTASVGGPVRWPASFGAPGAVLGRTVVRVIHRTAMAFRAVKGKQVTFRSACEPAPGPESVPSNRYGSPRYAGEVLA